jgi:hypothetical protein
MVCNQLQPYIHKINTFQGTAICLDFFFPNDNKSHIISTYLPSNHPSLLKKTQSQLLNWITEARAKNWHLIILGDFNANQFRDKHFLIFTNLNAANLTSLLAFHNIQTPTWHGPTSASQIDDFWISSDILLAFEPPSLTDASYISGSNHCILSTTWYTNFSPQKNPRNKKKKEKYICSRK